MRALFRFSVRALPCALLLPLAAGGCTLPRFTKQGADKEVYCLLDDTRTCVPEVAGTLNVEARERLARAAREKTAFDLTLKDALTLGTLASREYRRQREDVYLAALDLTREINVFRPQWFLGGTAGLRANEDDLSFDGGLDANLQKAFTNGGSVVVGLVSDFLRNITGNPLRTAQSVLTANILFPLMRGSSQLVVREPLRQAERNTLYAMRSYARFQQEFTVDIATRFYRALQARDAWKNAEARYESLELLLEEQRAKSVDRIPKFEVDQVEQDVLASDDARVRAKNNFEAAVDRLKLDLGIPVAVDVVLDDSDLQRLRREGLPPPSLSQEDALAVAKTKRLDLLNARDREVDGRRRILVLKDALRAGLDIVAGADATTPRDQPGNLFDSSRLGTFGVDFDLPTERTNERNAYRRAIILAERARRDREQVDDTVVFDVRDAYRVIAEAERSYEIQQVSVELAERRVESTQILLEVGRAQTRDRLESEDALVRARNAATAALVDQALARLSLERDVGTLRVDAEGMWQTGGNPPPACVVKEAVPEGRPAPPAPATTAPVEGAAPEQAPASPAPPPGSLPPPRVIPRRSGTVGK